MSTVTLLIGGNQGDRHALIAQATELIRQRIGSVVALSSLFESEPWGDFEDQPKSFLNQALQVETPLTATAVLHEALGIEKELGRVRNTGDSGFGGSTGEARLYHSRPMDIDLIFYDDVVMDTPELTLPHPRMHLRRFVLEPLAEIISDYRHPVLGKTIKELLSEL